MVGDVGRGAKTIDPGRACTSMRSVMKRNRVHGGEVWRVAIARRRGAQLVGGHTRGPTLPGILANLSVDRILYTECRRCGRAVSSPDLRPTRGWMRGRTRGREEPRGARGVAERSGLALPPTTPTAKQVF
jgi:hypothetical protein